MKKRMSKCILLCIVIFTLICTSIIPVSAKMSQQEFLDKYPKTSSVINTIYPLYSDKFSWLGEPAFGIGYDMYTNADSNMEPIQTFLKLDFKSGIGAQMWNIVEVAYKSIQAVGSVLVALYFLIELVEKSTSDNMSPEVLVRMFIKLIVALMFVQNCFELLQGGLKFVNGIVGSLTGNIGGGNTYASSLVKLAEQISENDLPGNIGLWLELLIPRLVTTLCTLLIVSTLIGRTIELVVRGVLAPIGMADIFESGTRSNGFRYFKKFIAVGLQSAIVYAVLLAKTALTATISSTFSGAFSEVTCLILASFATIGIMAKTQSWANDVLGVS